MHTRSRFTNIFAFTDQDKVSNGSSGFCHQVFTVPLCGEDDDPAEPWTPTLPGVEVSNNAVEMKLERQESQDVRSPLIKQSLKHITNLLDDDDECLCPDSINQMVMAR